MITTADLIERTGLSYRQLDYWTRIGYLRPDVEYPGSGNRRMYSNAEGGVAVRMAALVRTGLEVGVAHAIARGDPDATGRFLAAVALVLGDQPWRERTP